MNRNTIALMKGLVCPPNDGFDNRIAVSTIQAKLMQYGYMLDEDAFFALAKADMSFIEEFHNEVISFLKVATGGKYNFKALYQNFPQEVMSMPDYELYWNAMRHYWSGGKWEPSTATFEREVKFENVKYKMISCADEARFDKIFTDLVSINQSLMKE